jgi:hypothetical protein
MTKYALTCECGNVLPVEIGQAGEVVVCQCGATLDVPPLRKLRHLPVVTDTVDRPAPTWNARHGIIATCLILATGLALWALWSRWTEPFVAPFDPVVRQQLVDDSLDRMTPLQGWQVWIERYRPLAERGFQEMQHQHAATIDEYVARQRFLQKALWVVAGCLTGAAVIAAVWPRQVDQRGRQGDKETRRMR